MGGLWYDARNLFILLNSHHYTLYVYSQGLFVNTPMTAVSGLGLAMIISAF